LIDIGSGTLRRIREAEINPETIEAVFLTHTHPDHIADLVPLIHMYLWSLPKPHTRTLHIFGPTKTERVVWGMLQLLLPNSYDSLPFKINIHEIGNSLVEFGTIKVTSRLVQHSASEPALGYRFDGEGKKFAFTGDSGVCPALTELGQGADLYIMEANNPNEFQSDGHLTPTEAAQIANQCQAKEIILTHLSPRCEGHDLKEEAREFRGEVTVAEDLLEVRL
jgi:ribonuclease BN (tRNA processing enzyme)